MCCLLLSNLPVCISVDYSNFITSGMMVASFLSYIFSYVLLQFPRPDSDFPIFAMESGMKAVYSRRLTKNFCSIYPEDHRLRQKKLGINTINFFNYSKFNYSTFKAKL